MKIKLLIGWVLFCTSLVRAEDFLTTCKKFTLPLVGGYCVHTPTENASDDILYYLHGMGGNEFLWDDNWYYTSQIRADWKSRGVRVPTVISVSFGTIWLLAEKNSSSASGLFEIFTQKLIPQLEKDLGGLKGQRLLLGESMGGINSIQLSLKTNLFDRSAILCAPMSEVSPFDTPEKIEAHLRKSRAWHYYQLQDPKVVRDRVNMAIQLVKQFYPTPQEWTKGDPLQLAANLPRSSTQLYVAVGFYDEFASYEGTEKFTSVLHAKNWDLDWRPQWGGHCVVDIPSVSKFIAP